MNSIHDLDEAIDRWFEEDIQDGDHTTLSTITIDASGSAELLVKEKGVLAGIDVAQRIFKRFDPQIEYEGFFSDGSAILPGVRYVVCQLPLGARDEELHLLRPEALNVGHHRTSGAQLLVYDDCVQVQLVEAWLLLRSTPRAVG